MTHDEILTQLYDRTLVGDKPAVVELTETRPRDGLEPEAMLFDALIPALEEVGARFERGDFFVPEMLIAGRAMSGALEILRPLLADTGAETVGTFLMGTVKGDVHDIGKNLVDIMLEGAGFKVVDLGVQVAPETFVEAIQEHKPDVVGFSAFLTTTMPMFKVNIEAIEKAGLRDDVIIMVGGAPVTQEYADAVGADGYAADAAGATKRAKELLAERARWRLASPESERAMHTILRSPSKEVVIGPDQPFCIIGERINPTGRKAFAEQLRGGDLSQVVVDVEEQVAGGRPRARREHGRAARPTRPTCSPAPSGSSRSTPTCRSASTRPWSRRSRPGSPPTRARRSSTPSPARRTGSSACCRSSRSTARRSSASSTTRPASRQTAQERLEVCKRLVDVVHGRYEIPLEDMVIDPLAMTVGADPQAVVITLETIRRDPRRVRAEHDARRLERLVRAARAGTRSTPRFLAVASYAGLTSAIMDARTAQTVDACRAADLLLGRDEWGDELDRGSPAGAGCGDGVTLCRGPVDDAPKPRPGARPGSPCASSPPAPSVRVPPGRDRLRRRLLERHRDRLDLRRPRHVQEVPRPDRGRRRPCLAARRARVHARGARRRLAARLPRAGRRRIS